MTIFGVPEIPALTTLMLEPAFRLLLAAEGVEPPHVPFPTGWKAVEAFASLPAAHQDDGVSFQTELAAEADHEPVLSVMFVRQLADPLDDGRVRVRRVALQYLYPPPPAGSGLAMEGQNIWQADHDGWRAFAAAVEATDEFRYALAARPDHVAFFTEEDLLDEAE
ncbi:MAG TPA: hypothetical protein VFX50_18825 [Gemmatimonadales bacterium]|nr:hypothetical protein [Gemmatimonadales bacterium]